MHHFLTTKPEHKPTCHIQSKITFFSLLPPAPLPPSPQWPKQLPHPKTLRSILLQYKPFQHTNTISNYSKPILFQCLSTSWDHSLQQIDYSQVFCLFLQNPNGLSLSNTNFSLQQDLFTCRDFGSAVLCLPETNTNWGNSSQPATCHQLLLRTWPDSNFQTSKSPETFLSNHQPGGTATIICGNWVSHSIDKGEDPYGLGWWSFMTLRGKGIQKVTVITAYNACPTTGATTFHSQQPRTLSRLQHQHDLPLHTQPRKQFYWDLQVWITHLQDTDHDIILAMDSNDSYDPDLPGDFHHSHPLTFTPGVPTLGGNHNGKLSTFIHSCGLVDPLARQHSTRPFPPPTSRDQRE